MNSDRIEKQIVVKSPRTKVWQALTDAKKFGSWFGVEVEGAFAPGAHISAMSLHPGHEGRFQMQIEEMVPERRFSWRWHPGSPTKDYSAEPVTLVVFELSDVPEGTLLSVVESGFDALPSARRASAYGDNERGWEVQLQRIERYVNESL